MKLFRPDGSLVDVPDDQAAEGLASGQYGLPAGTKIPWEVGGQVGTLDFDPQTFSQAVKLGGKVTTPDAVAKAEKSAYLEQEYGGAGNTAAAAALGFADTATLGAAPAVAGALGGPEARRYMRNVEEAHPTASAAGSVAGLAAPIAADLVTAGAATPEVAPVVARTGLRLGEGAEAARLAEAGASAAPKLAEGAEAMSAAQAVPEASGALKTAAQSPAAMRPPMATVPNADVLKTALESPGAKAAEMAEGVQQAAFTSGTVESSGVKAAADAAKAGVEEAVPVARAVAESAVGRAAEAEPGLFSQAAQAAVKGATAPARLVSEVGSMVEKMVGEVVGTEAESVLGRMAQKGVRLGARGAAEGALYEAGGELSNESKQDHPDFTAQKFLTAMWRGAKFGAAGGAALGGAGSILGDGVRRAAPGLLDRANSLTFKALDKSGGLEREFVRKFGPEAPSSLREMLIDSGVLTAGARIDEMAPRLADQAALARRQYLDGLASASRAGLALDDLAVADVVSALRKEFPKPKLASLDQSGGVVDRIAADLKGQAPNGMLSFDQAVGLVKELDGLASAGAVDAKAASRLQDRLMEHVDSAFERAVKAPAEGERHSIMELLSGMADVQTEQVRAAADRYRKLSLASRYADESASAFRSGVEKAAVKGATGLPKGLEVAGGVYAAASALGHGAAGVQGLAAGYAAKLAKRVFQERGASAAAVALDEVALRAGAREAGDQVQRRIDRAVGSVFRKESEGVYGTVPDLPSRLSYEERVDRLLRAANTAEESTDRIVSEIRRAGLRDERLTQSVRQGYLRSVNYLLGEVPKPPRDPNSLQPELQQKEWEPSEGDKADFNRKYDVVTHPEDYVRRVADGTVTPSETKALIATHPDVHDYAVQSMKRRAAQAKRLVLPSVESSIRRAEGVPLLNPKTAAAFRQVDKTLGQAGHQSGGGGGGPRGALKLDVDARGLTSRGKQSKY